jgi:hypothetical protein
MSATLFDANTILKADTDDTPIALAVSASNIVGRKSTGGIASLTAAETRTVAGVKSYYRNIDYSIGKVLVVEADVFRWYNNTGRTLTIDKAWASFAASSTVTFLIKKNGSTVVTLTLSAVTNAVQTPSAVTIADGEYLTIDVSSVSGSPQYGIVSIDLSAS